jgi:tetratricopeptide (TPR) repeat protein
LSYSRSIDITTMQTRRELGFDNEPLSAEQAVRVGQELGAEFVIDGAYTVAQDRDVHVRVHVRKVKEPKATSVIEHSGQEHDIASVVGTLGAKLKKALGGSEVEAGEERGSLPSNVEAVKLYVAGLQRLRKHDFLGAAELLQRASEHDSQFPLIHLNLAVAWLSAGYSRRAQHEAKQALALSGSLSREERLRVEGCYFEALGDWKRAADRFGVLWQFASDNLEYGLHYAGVLRADGRFTQALRVLTDLRRVRTGTTEDPRVDLSEARVYYLMGEYRRQCQLARTGAAKAIAHGLRLPVAEARLLAGC